MYKLDLFDSGTQNHTWFEVNKIEKDLAYITRYARSPGKITKDYLYLRTRDRDGRRTVMIKDGHLWVEDWVWDIQLAKFGPRAAGPNYASARYQSKRKDHAREIRQLRRKSQW